MSLFSRSRRPSSSERRTVAGVASTATEALDSAEELRPEVVLVDIMFGDESGFDLARRLVGAIGNGRSSVILISTHAEAEFVDLIAASPAAGFLPKSELSAEAIRQIVSRGGP